MTHVPTIQPDSQSPSVDQPQPVIERLDSRSSVYEKLTPDQRRKIDRALIDRDPPTYRAVFKKFNLAARGLSFTAFYSYARHVRRAAAATQLAERTGNGENESDVVHTLPKLLGELLLEYLTYPEEASPNTVHRLTQAYKIALTGRKMLVDGALEETRRLNEENRALADKAHAYVVRGVDDLLAIQGIRRENERFRRAFKARGLDPDAVLKIAEQEEEGVQPDQTESPNRQDAGATPNKERHIGP